MAFGSAKMFQIFLGIVDNYFARPLVKAPLSRRVHGIEGQTNTLSDPPLHVDHGDAIYLGIVRQIG